MKPRRIADNRTMKIPVDKRSKREKKIGIAKGNKEDVGREQEQQEMEGEKLLKMLSGKGRLQNLKKIKMPIFG